MKIREHAENTKPGDDLVRCTTAGDEASPRRAGENQRWQAGAARRVLSWCLNGSGWASTVTQCQLLCGYRSDRHQIARVWTLYPLTETCDCAARSLEARGRSRGLSVVSVIWGLLDCARAWHRPSWPVGGFVKRGDPPRLRAEHIGVLRLFYPAGLPPWTTPSSSRYINALWVVGTLPPFRLHPSVYPSNRNEPFDIDDEVTALFPLCLCWSPFVMLYPIHAQNVILLPVNAYRVAFKVKVSLLTDSKKESSGTEGGKASKRGKSSASQVKSCTLIHFISLILSKKKKIPPPSQQASQTPLGAFLQWISLPASVGPCWEPTLMNTSLSWSSCYILWIIIFNYNQWVFVFLRASGLFLPSTFF